MTVAQQIHDALPGMTAAEKKTARVLLARYPIAGLSSVAEFADLAGTSGPTVLRFVAKLGYPSYPEFQRALRGEIHESLMSPLDKDRTDLGDAAVPSVLSQIFERVRANLAETARDLSDSELDAACALLGDLKHQCYCLGGRFSDSVAAYMASHLRIVRPGVRRFEGQVSTWRDQILDVRAGDVAVIFDIRRYQEDLLEVAGLLSERKARIVLVTDQWLSPIARHAQVVLPCRIDTGRTWDSSAALLVVAEVIVNRVTQEGWATSKERIRKLETLAKVSGGSRTDDGCEDG
ncbi:MAG: MurR/RpiR family transcriptional regulator [Kiloniellales bacterium]|nr:MurR/RpiR family transcriptional regulator [Kiloniellales bacterium]